MGRGRPGGRGLSPTGTAVTDDVGAGAVTARRSLPSLGLDLVTFAGLVLATFVVVDLDLDGGRSLAGLRWLVAGLVLLLPGAVGELRRSDPRVRWLTGLLGAGVLVALVAAGDRSGWIRGIVPLVALPLALLAARRVLRHRFGAAALVL
ncbi:MAG: hypothetical protein ACRDVN_05670, partial [Jiangellaceae bacterium]